VKCMENQDTPFPKNFFWGAATSAHQAEGSNRNDWTEWERENARRLTEEAKKKQWSDFILQNYPNPLQEENYISGRACDHYNRFREDFDIARSLGHNAHRFSIEWSRIEPEEGKFDEREIEHYREVIRALRERGIEPFVTLWHWTLPSWVRDRGGWENKDTIRLFVRYCRRIVEAFSGDIKFWITLNEPNVYASHGYLKADWPPQKRSVVSYLRVMKNLAAAHRAAYQELKRAFPDVQVGIAQSVIYFSGLFSIVPSHFWNIWFLNKICSAQDFVGVNYYFSNRKQGERSDVDSPIDPRGLYYMAKQLGRYHAPLFITENGIADARDEKRAHFIREHLQWLAKAMAEGVDVRGYFYWSLLDNFEWASGFWPRFGLVEVDYRTMERRIRQSAWEYKKIVEGSAP